jgi:predicted phage tail protein
MKPFLAFPPLALAALLSGCVSPPSGPDVTALPGTGKSYEQFNLDEAQCRSYAQGSIGGGAQTAANNAAGTAAAGTLVGAAAGALMGAASGHAGPGALVGAGGGLLVGSALANNSSSRSSEDLQDSYDRVYTQCMYAKGNKVPVAYGDDAPQGSPVPPDYYPQAAGSGVPPDYYPGQ